MTDLLTRRAALEGTGRALAELAAGLRVAARADEGGEDGLGDPRLDAACTGFGERWSHGVRVLASSADDAREAVERTATCLAEADRALVPR